MEYEIKLTAFLDILGFGKLVENSAKAPDLVKTIFEFLSSIDKNKVHTETFMQLNLDAIPPEELDSVIESQKLMAQAISSEWPIIISYFSDSLVLSASNSNACYMILESIANMTVRIWEEYRLLIRGGISIGQLVHVDNGPIFGPAMNAAYFLESKKAVNPRVIVDNTAFESLKNVDLYAKMNTIFSKSEDYVSINLASSFNYLINFSTASLIPEYKRRLINALDETPNALAAKIAEFENEESIKSKYVWIKNEIDNLLSKKS